ncbi:MAG: hypothetical protein ACE5ES_02735, partial [Candidatus Nanoarchaeia archaeon]
ITTNISKRIVEDKYDLLLIPQEDLKKALNDNIMPLFPMLKEAKPIVNEALLIKYRNTKLTKKNARWHIDVVRSGLKVNRAALDLENELKNKYASDAIAYSLVLHLRSIYIVDNLMKNKIWKNKEFIGLVKKIAGSKLAYEGYIRIKANKKRMKTLPIDQAEKLYSYIQNKLKEQEKSI